MKKVPFKTPLLIIVILVIGIFIGRSFSGNETSPQGDETLSSSEQTIWTCSMHPQIRKTEPGDCPICGMDLIPLESSENEVDPMAVSMSPTAMQLANIQTTLISGRNAQKILQLTGKVQEDERLIFTQSSHISGRVEKLNVAFTGDYIKQGDVLATVYSPELVTAQKEVHEARKMKETQPELYQAALNRLKNWKLTSSQIQQISEANGPIEQFPILANVAGYVTQKMVNLGDYIKAGQPIYEIADLSKMWVLFDVYEQDLEFVKKGSSVSFTVASLPGKTFSARISYMDPSIGPKTRVAHARAEISNKNLVLKPEMFVSGTLESTLQTDSELLSVPKSSVLWTGKRSVIYVKSTSSTGVNFKMREVTIAQDLGDFYAIEGGLQMGEEIAVNGTFSIDAAAQLAGKPSMMSPEGGAVMTEHNHGNTPSSKTTAKPHTTAEDIVQSQKAKDALKPLLTTYLTLKEALAADRLKEAQQAGIELKELTSNMTKDQFDPNSKETWVKLKSSINSHLQHIHHFKTLADIRKAFIHISQDMIAIVDVFSPVSEDIYVMHCPMADNDKGADWLSNSDTVKNPYFGQSMLKCGAVKRKIQSVNN